MLATGRTPTSGRDTIRRPGVLAAVTPAAGAVSDPRVTAETVEVHDRLEPAGLAAAVAAASCHIHGKSIGAMITR